MLALPTLLVALDMTVFYLALPERSADLRAASTAQLWISNIYGFLTAGFPITMDNRGRPASAVARGLTGAAGFGLFSTLDAYAPSTGWLILFRALLGIAGATRSRPSWR